MADATYMKTSDHRIIGGNIELEDTHNYESNTTKKQTNMVGWTPSTTIEYYDYQRQPPN